MNDAITRPLPLPALSPRSLRWRTAFVGLTPQVVGIVAAILLARASSSLVLNPTELSLTDRCMNTLSAFFQLVVQSGPLLLAVVAASNLGPRSGFRRFATLAVAIVVSAFVGVFLRVALTALADSGPGWDNLDSLLMTVWPRYALLGGALTFALEFHRHELDSQAAIERAKSDQAALERQVAESRLQVLQAQIEPHFLFNSLATVRRLYDTDPPQGAAMLDNLMRYFEVALPSLRESETPLGREADLAETYLRIHQIRMGKRLQFSIDVPESLRTLPIPPLMLLTLVENAIKHGIGPSPEGGSIEILAEAKRKHLWLSVRDSGVGLVPGSGTGAGLANIRARLAVQFGDAAQLSLQNNAQAGVTARIRLPLPVGGAE